nr:60S acidic ribosomal protein P2-like [Tanacetum cinerariifolium]
MDLKTILGSVGADADEDRLALMLSEIKGKDITEIIPSGGGSDVAVVAIVGGGAAPPVGGVVTAVVAAGGVVVNVVVVRDETQPKSTISLVIATFICYGCSRLPSEFLGVKTCWVDLKLL